MTPSTFPALSVPQLLVSVRSAAEAREALRGGCDILDVKEPARGPLGFAGTAVVEEIVHDSQLPVSCALGEVVDWLDLPDRPCLPPGLSYLKLGLSGLRGGNWQRDWLRIRAGFENSRQPAPSWIAVAYADSAAAAAPPVREIITAAADTACAGVLIDTFDKSAGGLLTCVTIDELQTWSAAVRRADMLFAVAGRLSLADLAQLANVPLDVIGIRGAACRNGQRGDRVDASRVRAFRDAVRWQFAGKGEQPESAARCSIP